MGRGLPSKYAKMGFAKGWKEYRKEHPKGKVYKRRTTTRKVVRVRVRKMAKRIRRRVRRYRARPRRKKDRRLSIIGTAGAVGSVFVPRRAEQMSMGAWLKQWTTGERQFQAEDVEHFVADTVGQYTGFDWRAGQPMFSVPWATVTIVASGIAAKIANKFGGKYLKNVPIVGKYVKF